MTLFFALSGLDCLAILKRKAAGSEKVVPQGYLQRRFWKIYPPYLALSVLILTPLYVWFDSDWSYLAIALKWLGGWAFVVPVSGKLNPVMWTLVIEVQFYLTLPLLFP